MLVEVAMDNQPSVISKPANSTQGAGELNLNDFQARLETSLGNIQAMVESWLPKELQSARKQPSSDHTKPLPPFGLDPSRPRNSKSGLGSLAPRQPQSQLSTSKLYSHLTKEPKKNAELTKAETSRPLNPQDQREANEEDSRTSTIGKKRPAPTPGLSSFDLLQPPSKLSKLSPSTSPHSLLNSQPASVSLQTHQSSANSAHNPNGLSKRQLKKLRKLERARSPAATNASSLSPSNPYAPASTSTVSECLFQEGR